MRGENSKLREVRVIDLINVLPESGDIQVRSAAVFYKGDEELTRHFHRHVVAPGDDLSGEDPRVVAIAKAVWPEKQTRKRRK